MPEAPAGRLGLVLTIVASEAPAAGHTFHPSREVIRARRHTHRGHLNAQLGGAGQLDQHDVIVDGVAVVQRVFEDLRRRDSPMEQHSQCW